MKASDHFHGPEGYNCAQAVLSFFREEYSVEQDMIDSNSASGGGRIDEGRCGALAGARMLVNDPEIKDQLDKEFAEATGYLTCREIRKNKSATCAECVDLAAEILKKLTSQETARS